MSLYQIERRIYRNLQLINLQLKIEYTQDTKNFTFLSICSLNTESLICLLTQSYIPNPPHDKKIKFKRKLQ